VKKMALHALNEAIKDITGYDCKKRFVTPTICIVAICFCFFFHDLPTVITPTMHLQ